MWHNLNLDVSWVVNEDGWILSGAEWLAWVPSTISGVLLRPHNALILSRNGSATISFTQGLSGVNAILLRCPVTGRVAYLERIFNLNLIRNVSRIN